MRVIIDSGICLAVCVCCYWCSSCYCHIVLLPYHHVVSWTVIVIIEVHRLTVISQDHLRDRSWTGRRDFKARLRGENLESRSCGVPPLQKCLQRVRRATVWVQFSGLRISGTGPWERSEQWRTLENMFPGIKISGTCHYGRGQQNLESSKSRREFETGEDGRLQNWGNT